MYKFSKCTNSRRICKQRAWCLSQIKSAFNILLLADGRAFLLVAIFIYEEKGSKSSACCVPNIQISPSPPNTGWWSQSQKTKNHAALGMGPVWGALKMATKYLLLLSFRAKIRWALRLRRMLENSIPNTHSNRIQIYLIMCRVHLYIYRLRYCYFHHYCYWISSAYLLGFVCSRVNSPAPATTHNHIRSVKC